MTKFYNVLEAAEYMEISLRELNELTRAGLIEYADWINGERIFYEESELKRIKESLYKVRDKNPRMDFEDF
jgi:predicted site-specific integrase-resolvase